MGTTLQVEQKEPGTGTIVLPTKRAFSWKTFLFIVAIMIPASFAVLPYSLTLQSTTVPAEDWPILVLVTLLNVLIYSVPTGIGLFLAGRIGLGLPFVEGWLKKESIRDRFRGVLLLSVIVGAAAALIVVGLSLWVFRPLLMAELDALGITLPEGIQPPPWQGFLASFYGGIVEEVLLRLFVLTLLVWLGSLVSRDSEGRPRPVVFWVANILAAITFGLWHLPSTADIGLPMSAVVITRAIVLNGLAGVAFGWLYWKRGLESAMIAHFSADIVAHVIVPWIATLVV